MEGFESGSETVPAPLVQVAGEVRERLIRCVAAAICGSAPAEVAACVASGEWPVVVEEMLERVGEREELSAHVDVWLGVLQAPAGAAE